jgi:2-methylfumaryl-CoA isomerase
VIVVALTQRQWDNLKAATHMQVAFEELAVKLGANLNLEGARFQHRHAITEVLKPFFDARRVEEFEASFNERSVTWSRYRTFAQAVREDPDISTDNPMFSMLDHPGIGTYLTPGNPIAFSDAERIAPVRAPSLGENTDEILSDIGYSVGEIGSLHDDLIVAGPK